MRNKKLVILTMAACMTTGLVAGCGAKSADTATPAETAAESTAAAEESGAEETEAAGDSTADEAYEPVTIT